MNEEKRLAIPVALQRQLLVEAGHRCAIPTCRQTPVEFAHIVPWSQCKAHTFENMIVLCPTCHSRYDSNAIDRKSMVIYKHNLGVVSNRYCDFEQRILRVFAEAPTENHIALPGGLDIMVMYLLMDGMLLDTGVTSGVFMAGMPSQKLYELTSKGRSFISRWMSAQEIA